jgi:hypothetical protein
MIRTRHTLNAAAAMVCAAVAGAADYRVRVEFQVEAIAFEASASQPYITFPFLDVQGFTDPAHADNYAELVSGGGDFTGWVNGPYGASSRGFAGVDDLKTALGSGPWVLSITDGATMENRVFHLTVNPALLTGEYVRPITMLGGIDNGSVIDPNQTFEWAMTPTANPTAAYTDAFIGLHDPAAGNGYWTPPITPEDRTWTPDGPILPGAYNLVMSLRNADTPDDLVLASAVAADGGADLLEFGTGVTAVSQLQLYDLRVIPGPGSLALLALGWIVAARRRR